MQVQERRVISRAAGLIAAALAAGAALAQSTFTYQGRLTQDGAVVDNPSQELTFELFDQASGGLPLPDSTIIVNVPVEAGLFTAELAMPVELFNGSDRWLQVYVGGSPLLPRQKVTAAPYALHTRGLDVDADGNVGIGAEARVGRNPADSFTYDGKTMSHYGIGWFSDTWNASGSTGWLSGYGGLKLFTGGEPQVAVDVFGKVGIGTVNPAARLDVAGGPTWTLNGWRKVLSLGGTSAPAIEFAGLGTTPPFWGMGGDTSGLYIFSTTTRGTSAGADYRLTIDASATTVDGILNVRDNADLTRCRISPNSGELSMFSDAGSETVEIDADESDGAAQLRLRDAAGQTTIELDAELSGGGALVTFRNGNGATTVLIDADQSDAAAMTLFKGDGSEGIFLDANNGIGGSLVRTQILEITGGSDLSEQFDVSAPSGDVQAGMVVCIDPANPGKLAVGAQAYDRRVAGVVSGAGGVKPGMLMGQSGSVADGAHPIALSGRVYVWCDASTGAIQPGDVLTTSDTPGHAMKVMDHATAQGAIIGKAMTSLESGRGLVLVLVSLQ